MTSSPRGDGFGVLRRADSTGVTPQDLRRVTLVPNGPMLVEGPVELVTDDGATYASDRFVVAVCVCRRSKRYPFCDTSHRKRVRNDDSPDSHDVKR